MQTSNNRGGKGIPIIVFVILALSMLFLFNNLGTEPTEQFYEISDLFKENKVESFTFDYSSGELAYKLKGDAEDALPNTYEIPSIALFEDYILSVVEAYNTLNSDEPIEYDVTRTSDIWAMIFSALPFILMVGVIIFFYMSMMGQGGGKIGSVGKARTKNASEEGRKATFDDVAGADEEKEELTEIVEYLKNPLDFGTLGAKIPRGVLLVGPPGTGKTLLARAVAGEAGVPFYSISGSDFVELYVGVGASRVRDLFDKAKKTRPAIIFIDEIDAVGRRRGAGLGGGHDEREQTLNQLLVEMDGFATNDGVIVMAATNRNDILDPALLRPGRFDREVYVGHPDMKGREAILKVHARNKPLGPDVDLSTIAKSTPGFTGADLENLLNEAALLAARKKRKAITEQDIEEATMKVIVGPEKKSRVVTEHERKLTAYHEAGHAIAHYYYTPHQPVHQISIIPRGMAGGYTVSLPNEDKQFKTKKEMIAEIITLLGGRVAESLTLDDISTGASNDLQRATAIARNMITKYGFSEKLGPVVYGSQDEVFLGRDFTQQQKNYSENFANEIDHEIKNLIEDCFDKCEKMLNEHKDKLEIVTKALLEFEKMDGNTFKAVMEADGEQAQEILSPLKEGNAEEQQTSEQQEAMETDETNVED